jgi:hypothetical protein
MGTGGSFRERRAGIGSGVVAVTVALALALALTSPARASIVVGSDLSETAAGPGQASDCAPVSPPCTSMLAGVKQGNPFPAASPASGTVVAFDIKTGGPSTVTFRLLRLDSAVAAKVILVGGDGTGPTVDLPGPGAYEFPAGLPIRAGDYVGFDSSLFSAYGACQAGASSYGFSPPLPDGGGALQPPLASGSCELLVNAVVAPSAALVFGRGTVARASGRATLGLRLPGPGELTLSGRDVKTVSKHIARAGRLHLPLSLKLRARNRLARQGSVKLKLSTTFTPTGGSAAGRSAVVRFRLSGGGGKRRG